MTQISTMPLLSLPASSALIPLVTSGINYSFDIAASGGSALVGFQQSGTGSVARTVQARLQDRKHIRDFNAVGNGTADDFTPLSNFINSANANPGVLHEMDAKTYATSQPLPVINVSNVWIEGKGAHIHDAGTQQVSGTVIKYIGASALSSSVLTVASTSGAGNQRIANIRLRGVGVDCNTGLVGYGLTVNSIRESDIDVLVLNAGTRGVNMGVVAALAEDKNIQRCKFRLWLRQSEVAVPCLYLDGDSVSNVSMNEFWVDQVHKNANGTICNNSDNNMWRYFRSFMIGGGTATDAVSLFGGPTSGQRSRAETFEFFTANLPIHAYGTADGYTVASTNHRAFLDVDNGTPVPTVGVGASVNFEKGSTATNEQAWVAYTPSVAPTSGSITTLGAVSGFYRQIGRRVEFKASVMITTNGTGAGTLNVGLPVNTGGSVAQLALGKETAVTGKAITGFIAGGGATVAGIQFYDGTYPGANGANISVSGSYEI